MSADDKARKLAERMAHAAESATQITDWGERLDTDEVPAALLPYATALLAAEPVLGHILGQRLILNPVLMPDENPNRIIADVANLRAALSTIKALL